MIYSFDIFDTLISRTTGTPAGIFSLMQKLIAERGISLSESQVAQFRNIRTLCERIAWSEHRPREITLDDIYTRVGNALQVPDPIVQELKELEIQCELQNIFPVHENIEKLLAALECGRKVVLTSDMYLPGSAIRKALDDIDPAIFTSSTLYLSSETGKTKRLGHLFEFIAEQERVEFKHIFHTGDNPNSDYAVPKSLGINATLVETTKLRKWESIGIASQTASCGAFAGSSSGKFIPTPPPVHYPELSPSALGFWESSSGLAKKARLEGRTNTFLLGYSIAGPLLIPFVYWVLNEASRRRINRLYFVARDGQIFLKIAKELQRRGLAEAIDLRYLYGSRRAWHLPSFAAFDEHDLFWILDTRHGLTLKKTASRLGLECEEFVNLLSNTPDGTLLSRAGNRILTESEIGELPRILQANEALKSRVRGIATEARQNLRDFLSQEGWDEAGVVPALVDIGWSGRSQDSLFRALNDDARNAHLTGFYFGLHRHSNQTSGVNAKIPFALHPQHFHSAPLGKHFFDVIHVIECLTAADHGGTINYKREAEKVVPVLDGQGDAVRNWGLEDYQQGVLEFTKDINLGIVPEDPAQVRARLRDLRSYMLDSYPEPEIAEVLGTFPYTPEMDGMGQAEFAPILTLSGSLRYLATNPKHRGSISSWINGSYVRSGLPSKMLLSKRARFVFTLLFHPLYSVGVGIRFAARVLPMSIRPRLRQVLPTRYSEKIESIVTGRKPKRKS